MFAIATPMSFQNNALFCFEFFRNIIFLLLFLSVVFSFGFWFILAEWMFFYALINMCTKRFCSIRHMYKTHHIFKTIAIAIHHIGRRKKTWNFRCWLSFKIMAFVSALRKGKYRLELLKIHIHALRLNEKAIIFDDEHLYDDAAACFILYDTLHIHIHVLNKNNNAAAQLSTRHPYTRHITHNMHISFQISKYHCVYVLFGALTTIQPVYRIHFYNVIRL